MLLLAVGVDTSIDTNFMAATATCNRRVPTPIFLIIPIFLLASYNFLYFREIPINSYIFLTLRENVCICSFLSPDITKFFI